MRSIQQTIPCPVVGYEPLELTYEINMRGEQLALKRKARSYAPALLDIPNWDQVARVCELMTVDPETGDLTDEPLCKPEFPLSSAALDRLPTVLMIALIGDAMMHRAAHAYTQVQSPNSNGASLDL